MTQLTFNELKNSGYYFRWAKTDNSEKVTAVSVERRLLSPEFEKYLKEHGYNKVKERGKKYYTDHFVY